MPALRPSGTNKFMLTLYGLVLPYQTGFGETKFHSKAEQSPNTRTACGRPGTQDLCLVL